MNKKALLLLPVLSMLFTSCNNSSKAVVPAKEYGDDKTYALYMYNFPRMTSTSVNGMEEKTENLLYMKKEIVPGEKLEKPEDPTRENYEFEGWYKEKKCLDDWDFENDVANSSVMLYAKWGKNSSGDYVEPEYVVPEVIVTDVNFEVTGVLNEPVTNGHVSLTRGGFVRLSENKDDVRFAINYKRKADVTMTSATYDEEHKKITVNVSSGETFEITATDEKIAQLDIGNYFPYYEQKAAAYENKGGDVENYHIMLGGSSSMEMWETSYEDMSPIVTRNHGIGGTTVEQWTNSLFERLFLPYSPKAVVYYVGVNDIINNNKDGQTTANNLKKLFDKTHEYLPNTHIFYVLINKLPGFLKFQPDFDVANAYAREYERDNDYLTCIDAGEGLLKETGAPNAAYFRTDGLHMSQYGYVIWGAAVKKAIVDWLG